ncbi:MAG TPA: hypothetical protein VFS95_09845, partial [Telluria sp.]|nr:hypothetical protein [Telluria sp.]
LAPSALTYDASGVGALFARSDWSTSASWLSLVAGVYDQSHAHQDQGSFSFYKGTWLSVTSNIYSHSGINQGVDMQNIVRFEANGAAIEQNNTVLTKTVSDTADTLQVTANLAPAYSSHAQQVSAWTRSLSYQRSLHKLQVHDQCSVAQGVQPVWQLHVPVRPTLEAGGTILAGKLRIKPILPSAPTVKVVDMHALSSEFNGGFRIELRAASGCEFNVELQAL